MDLAALRIGVILVGLPEQKGGTDTLRYLITHMNAVQSSVEFELYEPPPTADLELLELLTSGSRVSREQARDLLPNSVDLMAQRLGRMMQSLSEQELPHRFVFVANSTFDDNYFSARRGRGSILAMGSWRTYMAPPSLVEFVLTLVIREVGATASPSLSGSVHLGTRGCLFDFDPVLSHVRYKVLNAFICRSCRSKLTADNSPTLIEDLLLLLSRQWLGKRSDAGTPAHISARLGHDLFTTKSLVPTTWETAKSTLQAEWLRTLLQIVGAILVALLVVLLGLKA